MTALTNTDPNVTYGSILQTGTGGSALTSSTRTVQDALGTNTALGLSTSMVTAANLTVSGTSLLNSLTLSSGTLALSQINIPASGNIAVTFADSTSAVNHIEIANESTGLKPALYTVGSDTNIGLSFQAKGTGNFVFQSGALQTNIITFIPNTGNLSNAITFSMSPTGSRVWTWQDSTDTVVGRNTTDTFTNKTLDTASNTFKIGGTTITGISGNGNVVLIGSATLNTPTLNSPTLVTPTLGVAAATSLVFSPTTNGIIGTTTNNNAVAGSVGEVISSQIVAGNAVSLVSNAAKNVASISLTAGDWDVSGNIATVFSVGTSGIAGGISLTTNTLPDASLLSNLALVSQVSPAIPVSTQRMSLSTTTTVYLVGQASFSSGTGSVFGFIYARRAR